MLATLWKNVYAQIHSWTYVLIAILLIAGLVQLLVGRRRPWLGFGIRLFAFLSFGGILGLLSPWVDHHVNLIPAPLTAFSRSIVFPVFYDVPAYAMFVMLALILGSTLACGRLFCGWVCPIGAVQELVGKLRRRRLLTIPPRVALSARTLLVILFLVLLFSGSLLVYDWLDPARVFEWEGLNSVAVWAPLAVVLALSLFVHRPFCLLVCPVGLMAWAVERVSLSRIQLSKACDGCGDCLKATPCAALKDKLEPGALTSDCFACGECIQGCESGDIRMMWRFSSDRRLRERGSEVAGRTP